MVGLALRVSIKGSLESRGCLRPVSCSGGQHRFNLSQVHRGRLAIEFGCG
jgi:hypothetical protein